MTISNRFLNYFQSEDNDILRENFKDFVDDILEDFFSDKPLFTADKIKTYYYDEYLLNTCVTPKSNNVLYLEIDQPANIKKWIQKPNRHTYPELFYSLKSLKSDLFDECVNRFNSDTLLWQTKYTINFLMNIYDEEEKVSTVGFEIIPCISYTNENGVKGIMYFNEDTREFVIEYPELAVKNFKAKNKKTMGLYQNYVVMFKNIFREVKNEKVLPSEIYETIVYNVPDILFENYSIDNIRRIINYLRNSSIHNFKSLDEQDYAFATLYRPMNIVYAKHVIKQIENYIKKIK